VRAAVLAVIVLVAVAAFLISRPVPDASITTDLPELSYVATAHQYGVVGYRDPFGAISPDGTRLAYAEGRFIRVVPVGGGAPITLAPGQGQIRYLAWMNNSTIIAEDPNRFHRWWLYDLEDDGRRHMWGHQLDGQLRQLTGDITNRGAALLFSSAGAELLRISGDEVTSTEIEGRPSWPAIRANGDVGCVVDTRLSVPCGTAPLDFEPARDVYGPIAFAADGNTVYFSSPNDNGMVELWSANLTTRRSRRLSNFNRDAYGPSVASDGTVVFKTQTYRTHLADIAVTGGQTRQLTTFQSETPSYHPSNPLIAFTYGTWRRVIDDAKYPDIAQEIGVVDVRQAVPALKPSQVLEDSDSEDQAMTWSPNGQWIAFHTHKEMSDDVWLRRADGNGPDRRLTFLGRGAEVGWPRWSPDGKTILLNGARKRDGASVLYTIGVDQDSGSTTSELREIEVTGVSGEMGHAEWMPGSASVIATLKEGPGRHAIILAPAAGGRASIVHRFESEHDFAGIGVSPTGRVVAFVAPAPDGFFQIFTKAIGANTPAVQLTSDRSHKTQPAFSPDGSRVAFTVWSYTAAFWSFKDR
jgi:Tol biopolymer transport system component